MFLFGCGFCGVASSTSVCFQSAEFSNLRILSSDISRSAFSIPLATAASYNHANGSGHDPGPQAPLRRASSTRGPELVSPWAEVGWIKAYSRAKPNGSICLLVN